MKIRFTVTLTEETLQAFTAAGHVTPSSIVTYLTQRLQSSINAVKAPPAPEPQEDPFEEDEEGEEIECPKCGGNGCAQCEGD